MTELSKLQSRTLGRAQTQAQAALASATRIGLAGRPEP